MAQDDERKVPPRTPAQRLNILKRFAGEWVNLQIGVTINRPNRAQRMVDIGIERLENKMTEASSKDCFYFDPTVPNGDLKHKVTVLSSLKSSAKRLSKKACAGYNISKYY
jgi:hypothetical protein